MLCCCPPARSTCCHDNDITYTLELPGKQSVGICGQVAWDNTLVCFCFLSFLLTFFFFFTTCTSNWALTPISDNLVMILKLVYIKYIITIKLSSKALYEHFLAVCAVACRILQTKVRAERQHKPTLECPQCAVVTVTGIFGWEHRSEKIQTNTSKKRRQKQAGKKKL